MKKAVFIIVLLCTFALLADGESVQTIIYPAVPTVYRYQDANNTLCYDTTASDRYLGKDSSRLGKRDETFRIIMRMDLSSIPDSALITGISFGYSLYADSTPAHFSYRVCSFAYSTSGAANAWTASTNTTAYRATISTQSTSPTFYYSTSADTLLTTAMENALAGNLFAVCLVSEAEATNKKFVQMPTAPSVTIHYIVPKIKVQNNFWSGQIKINGAYYNSGTELFTKVGRQLTIEGNNQEYNAAMKYFLRWRLPGDNTTTVNPYTFTVTKLSGYSTQTYRPNTETRLEYTRKTILKAG